MEAERVEGLPETQNRQTVSQSRTQMDGSRPGLQERTPLLLVLCEMREDVECVEVLGTWIARVTCTTLRSSSCCGC